MKSCRLPPLLLRHPLARAVPPTDRTHGRKMGM
jgi:hypothetical protein